MLLLDAQGLDGNGLELARKLREEPRTRELPVLMLAGRSPQEEGVVQPLLVDWMEKPFEETRFLLALRHAIRRPGSAEGMDVAYQLVHKLHGTAGSYGFHAVSGAARHLEALLRLARDGQAAPDWRALETARQELARAATGLGRLER